MVISRLPRPGSRFAVRVPPLHRSGSGHHPGTSSAPRAGPRLEGSRQAEHVLGEVGQDQVGRDRGDEVEAVLPEFSLHVVLGGEAETAVRLQAHVRRFP
jgi:hypothetical protein